MTAKVHLPICLLAALLAAGCASSTETPTTETLVPTEPEAPVRTARAAPAQPAPDIPKSDELIGLNGDALRGALGKASLVRRDLGTEIWQYRTENCVLFLFLYPKDGTPSLHHLDARGGDMETCLKTVVLRAKRAAAG